MGLAVFKAKQPITREIAQDNFGIGLLKLGQCRCHERCQTVQRGHDQFTRYLVPLAFDATRQLAKLLVRGLRNAAQVFTCFCRGIAARMALEELHAKALLQRIYMADHRRMMHAKHIRCAADRAHARNLIGGAYLIPIVHLAAFCA